MPASASSLLAGFGEGVGAGAGVDAFATPATVTGVAGESVGA
jgi:hypothetical protein